MRPSHGDWNAEQLRLERILGEIERQLESVRTTARRRRQGVIATRTSIWEELPRQVRDFDDVINLSQQQEILNQQEREYLFSSAEIRRLERLADSPYFGRIDFIPAGSNRPIEVYIGLSSLVEAETGAHLVFDWRAPISSMFYDFEPGRGGYRSGREWIEGEITLKRQYKIVFGRLEYFFDTDLAIEDEMLRDILGRSADQRMRVIVQTIQREQNQVIRNEDDRLLVVHGPAGSGKTAIALHRIAYLLYRHRANMTANQIVVISPNRIFSDYISDVLPHLGEENMLQTTFAQEAQGAAGSRWVEEQSRQLDWVFSRREGGEPKELARSVGVKTSPAFYELIMAYIKWLEAGNAVPVADISVRGRRVVTRDELLRLFTQEYAYLPYVRRLEKVVRRVHYLLEPIERQRVKEIEAALREHPRHQRSSEREIERLARRAAAEEFDPVKAETIAWGAFDPVAAYLRLFEDRELAGRLFPSGRLPGDWDGIARRTARLLRRGRIPYEDAAPLLLLAIGVGALPAKSEIRHVVVDESQDYSVCHFGALRKLYPRASFTILGDPNQAIHPYANGAPLDALEQAMEEQSARIVSLSKSYRSTAQILDFAGALLGKDAKAADAVGREGPKPLIVEDPSREAAIEGIVADLLRLSSEGHRSIALICTTSSEAKGLFQAVQKRLEGRSRLRPALLTREDATFKSGLVVLPAYLAKGLEFDAVILFDAGARSYPGEGERRLLYTACTRALHRLILHSVGPLSPLIKAVDHRLYERVRSRLPLSGPEFPGDESAESGGKSGGDPAIRPRGDAEGEIPSGTGAKQGEADQSGG